MDLLTSIISETIHNATIFSLGKSEESGVSSVQIRRESFSAAAQAAAANGTKDLTTPPPVLPSHAGTGTGKNGSTVLSCAHHDEVPLLRYVLLVWFASVISTFGFLCNVLLFRVFQNISSERSAGPKRGSNLFLRYLAGMDAILCFSYVAIFGTDAFSIYHKINALYTFYTYYSIPLFWLSRIAQITSAYLTIAATMERLLITKKRAKNSRRRRQSSTSAKIFSEPTTFHYSVIASVILVAVGLRTITFFELYVKQFLTCPPDTFGGSMAITMTGIQSNQIHLIFDFYIIFCIRILIPFVVMVSLNILILTSLRRTHQQKRIENLATASVQCRNNTNGSEAILKETSNHQDQTAGLSLSTPVSASAILFHRIRNQTEVYQVKKRVSNATSTFIWITTMYILCNSLSMFINMLERIPGGNSWLFTEYIDPDSGQPVLNEATGEPVAFPNQFYIVTTDIISFLYMFNSAIRILIYLVYDPKVRAEILLFLRMRNVE